MKKFEEELKIIPVMGREPIRNQALYSKCDIVELSNGWVSPEDHQAEVEKRKQQYGDHQEIYSKTAKKLNEAELELSKLKSQLEKLQPEIPEVPLFVEEYAQDCERELSYLLEEIYLDTDYLEDHSTRNEREDLIARYWLYNRTVAKEKRFYLKHIDFCKRHKDYDWYMIKHSDGPLNHLRVEKGTLPPTVDTYFTQQEIDSMETGSYEQIEVEE